MCSLDNFPSARAVSAERPLSVCCCHSQIVKAHGSLCSHGERERASFCVFIFTQIRLTVETPAYALQKWPHFKRAQKMFQAQRRLKWSVCVCDPRWLSDSGSRGVKSPIESSAPRWSVCSHWGIPSDCSFLPKWKKQLQPPSLQTFCPQGNRCDWVPLMVWYCTNTSRYVGYYVSFSLMMNLIWNHSANFHTVLSVININCILKYFLIPINIKWHPYIVLFHTVYTVVNDLVIPLLSRSLFLLVSSGAWTKYFIVHWALVGEVPSLWQFLLCAQLALQVGLQSCTSRDSHQAL